MTQARASASDSLEVSDSFVKRARRRLIGAAALALAAAIVLPLVMDHQPAPPLAEIQVRIPSPDDSSLRPLPAPKPAGAQPAQQAEAKEGSERGRPSPSAASVAETPSMSGEEGESARRESHKLETATGKKGKETDKETGANSSASEGARWEVQLGAYQNPASVVNLVGKLKELGLPSYTEKVTTPRGERTRVRAGPFSSQEAAEKARQKIKTIGVDGVVASSTRGSG